MKLAYFSPLNPQRSGISDYSEELLPHLAAAGADITLFVDGFEPSNKELRAHFRWFDYRRDPAALELLTNYDAVVYHMGNDHRYHAGIVEVMQRYPGIAVFHDFALQDFFLGLARQRKDRELYLNEMLACHGVDASREATAALERGGTPSAVAIPTEFPLNSRLARSCEGIIVHSEWSRSRFESIAPGVPTARIDMPVRPPLGRRDLVENPASEVSIATFGLITPGKGIERTLRALASLRDQHSFRYTLVGAPNPYFDVAELIRDSDLTERVSITGHVPLAEFEAWIACTDIAVNLRDRTVGETSASLCRIMAAGVPSIVSNTGWFAELPGDCVVKLDLDEHAEVVLQAYLEKLIKDANLRRRIGENAKRHAATHFDLEQAAKKYADFISSVIAGRAASSLIRSVSREVAALGVGASDEAMLRAVAADVASLMPNQQIVPHTAGNGSKPPPVRSSSGLAAGDRERSDAGRTAKIEGVDYKRAALQYLDRLSNERRHHLRTKPFYNLAHKLPRYKNAALDEDSHRHFCDFANMAVTLALPPGGRLLDVGCGSGWLSEYFSRLGYVVKGIDISPGLIEMARERIGRVPYPVDETTPLRCEFEVYDIEQEPLQEKFDAIICYDALHHFEDEKAVFRNLAAMLDIGGALFILEGERPPEGSDSEEWLRSVMLEFQTLESPFGISYLRSLLDENGFAVVGNYVGVNGLFERESIQNHAVSLEGMETSFNYLLCKKVIDRGRASTVPDSRLPGVLKATLTSSEPLPSRISHTAQFQVRIAVQNDGNTLWLTGQSVRAGMVMPGMRVIDENQRVVVERHGPLMPRAIAGGESIVLKVDCVAPDRPGRYKVKIDLIDQNVCWFEDRGSTPIVFDLEVE